MPKPIEELANRLQPHILRAVWITWSITMLVAAVIYGLKAAESRSAFVRWQHQILEIGQGVNIWDRYYFPNPPILPVMLYALMILPPVIGAVAWYAIKVGMTTWSALALSKMAVGRGKALTGSAMGLILLLSIRPIMSDLQHGNINLLILFLTVACLHAWQRGRDVWAGVFLGLAIATKVTPALFVPYFLYRRSWKTASSATASTMLFLLVVPSLFLGPRFNWECLMKWRQNIISPFVEGEVIPSVQEVNQSMAGVLARVLTRSKTEGEHGNGHIEEDNRGLNLASFDPELVTLGIKGLAIGMVALLGVFCRTRADRRDDPRWLGEFSLVVLTMLFVSERSWKHHYVTVLLPYTYLIAQLVYGSWGPRQKRGILAGILASVVLMGITAPGVGGLFLDGRGADQALFYGMFLWSAMALYVTTAWLVLAQRDHSRMAEDQPISVGPHRPMAVSRRPRPAEGRV